MYLVRLSVISEVFVMDVGYVVVSRAFVRHLGGLCEQNKNPWVSGLKCDVMWRDVM